MARAGNVVRLLAAVLAMMVLAGCVERRFVIDSEPFGAVVFDENDQPISQAPADKQFTYYGKYRFKLVKDGYKTLIVEERIRAPWYELPGLDFISENLIPWTIRDVRRKTYPMEPIDPLSPERSPDKVKADGELLRQQAVNVGPQMLQSR
jgi:hypothetical protein